ncbi:MAG: hypothetical protein BGN96_05890 [Bacteroidales bacterium 45-6]|nr:MAG: hypothetical protein BGN96_05890 [Bacteroidales bacterium 45-6]
MSRKSIFVTLLVILSQSGFLLAQKTKGVVSNSQPPNNIFVARNIAALMEKTFDWQIKNPFTTNDYTEQWARSVLYSGVMYAYKTTGSRVYIDQTIKWGDGWDWKRGVRYRHADDLACGHAYLDAYSQTKKTKMLTGIKSAIDSLMADPKAGREDWWWCDALFMAPPVLVRLGNATNEAKYYDYLDKMYWDTVDYLYSPADSLFFRDKSFFHAKTKNGKKVFWSRGNAWVIGGLTQMLDMMPKNEPSRSRYLALYKKMIYKIVALQQPDGLWRASLLDSLEIQAKETSGSTFFAFAMAWGVNNGILPERIFVPKIQKAWAAIVRCINEDGRLGYVQPIGAMPEDVKADDNQEYGTGAFLMVGSEMIKMSKLAHVKNKRGVKPRKGSSKTNSKDESTLKNITRLTIK